MKKKKTSAHRSIFGIVIGLLMGFAIGFAIAPNLENFTLKQYFIFLIVEILLLTVAFYIQTIVHEAGHLIFGLLSGYKFLSFRVGRFMLIKKNGKLTFGNYSVAGTGGQCLMSPPDMINGKFPVVIYNMGGVILNLVFSAAIFPLIMFTEGKLYIFLLMVFLFGIFTALINGIPMTMGLIDNDGKNAISLAKNPEVRKGLWFQLKMNEMMCNDVRLKDMPDEWFEIPSKEAMKNPVSTAVAVFRENRFMDAKDFDSAAQLADSLLNSEIAMVGLHKCVIACDRIYCEYIGENRQEIINELMTKEQINYMKAMKGSSSVMRTEYAKCLLNENDPQKAQKIRECFDKISKKYPYKSDLDSERELMDIALEIYNAKQKQNN